MIFNLDVIVFKKSGMTITFFGLIIGLNVLEN